MIEHVGRTRVTKQMGMHRLESAELRHAQKHSRNTADTDRLQLVSGVAVPHGEKQHLTLRLVLPYELGAFGQVRIQRSLRVRIQRHQPLFRGKPAHATLPMNKDATLLRPQIFHFDVGSFRNSQPGAVKQFEDEFVALLRHTACTTLLEGGVPYPVVSTIMGWSAATGMRMAKRYGHIGQRSLRDAMELLGKSGIAAESPKNSLKSPSTEDVAVN
jgi:hypothetical protein